MIKEKPSSHNSLATECDKGFDEISNFSSRLGRLGEAKSRQVKIVNHIANHHKGEFLALDEAMPIVRKMEQCGMWLKFNQYYTVDKVRLQSAYFCNKHLLCPLCAILRASKQLRAYLERFNVLRAQNPDLKPYFLTLTVRNGESLEERFNHLRKSFKTYTDRRRDSLKKGRGFNELSKVLGGGFFI